MKYLELIETDGRKMRFSFESDKDFIVSYCTLLRTLYDCIDECYTSTIEDHGTCYRIQLCDEESEEETPPPPNRREGRWKGAGFGDYYCSLCQETVSGDEYSYCPHCGAFMK